MKVNRFIKFTASIFCLLLGVVLFFAFKSFTPPIIAENAISELTTFNNNGDEQSLLIRGHDLEQPLLLFLHGGPGMPAMFLAHDFQRELEKHFVIVHWDQRGAGKSYKPNIDTSTLSISNLLRDTDTLVDHLLSSFSKDSLWLLGHSHGTYLGALYARRHPDKVKAFVGVGQIGDFEREAGVQEAFLLQQLDSLGLPADTEINDANREELLFRTGSELYRDTSFIPLIISGMLAMEYSLFDILKVQKGSSLSSRHMKYDMNRDLIREENIFSTPVALIMGAHDMTTPVSLARDYYDAIEAPAKRFISIPDTAHFPHFEEPDAFLNVMLELKSMWN